MTLSPQPDPSDSVKCHRCGDPSEGYGCEHCKLPTCPACLTVTMRGRICRGCIHAEAKPVPTVETLLTNGQLVRMLDPDLSSFPETDEDEREEPLTAEELREERRLEKADRQAHERMDEMLMGGR